MEDDKKKEPARGRPSLYTNSIADEICARLAAGESLNAICKEEKFPAESTVRGWAIDDVGGFFAKYARAREIQADILVDEIIEISDDGSRDVYKDKDGKEVTNNDVIARSRLRVDSRKWFASKVAPKKYGDRITHSGDERSPIALTLEKQMQRKLLSSIPANVIDEVISEAETNKAEE